MQKAKMPATCLLVALQTLAIILSSPVFAEAENGFIQGFTVIFPKTSIERKINLISGGYLIINDTFILTPHNFSDSIPPLTSYIVGLPKNYSSNLVYFSADSDGEKLAVTPVENADNFLWLNISFPKPIELVGNATYNFTMSYVFSGLIARKSGNLFHVDFPLYPSLTSSADHCNVTVTLPVAASSYPRESLSNKTATPTVLYNFTSPLASHANISSWVEFSTSTFELFELKEMRREIAIDSWGKITVTDFYQLTSMVNVYRITFILPKGASDISIYDAYGKYEQSQILVNKGNYTEVDLTTKDLLRESSNVKLAVSYTLPLWGYITKSGWQDYALNINITKPKVGIISKPETWIVKKIKVSVSLPEGAAPQGGVEKEWLNVTKLQNLNFSLKYQYNILWAAFKPTLWAGLAMGLAILIFSLIKSVGKTEVYAATVVSSETIRKFIELLEERNRIVSEIESLDQQSRRRKISRRHYRLQRRTLEERLSIIQRDFSNIKREIESFGARYANMMRRFETANVDIETMNKNIADVESRYQRGEISAEARKKLLDEYGRKKENAESIIDEILIRLKEELR
ncbi:MAG: hypothetical protein QXR06_01745 [Candidatus Bathyarchaeia archaeon]